MWNELVEYEIGQHDREEKKTKAEKKDIFLKLLMTYVVYEWVLLLFCPQALKQVFTTVMLNRCDVTLLADTLFIQVENTIIPPIRMLFRTRAEKVPVCGKWIVKRDRRRTCYS